MNQQKLDEKVKQARKLYSLPPDITTTKKVLPDGRMAYVFRHVSLGELGRVIIVPHTQKQSQFVCEVSGDAEDPMTQIRREIFEPIARGMLNAMEQTSGSGSGTPEPFSSPKEQHTIESKIMPCDYCGLPAAMMVIAGDAITADRLEDYARMLYSKYNELNVPTWIVGAEKEVCINGEWMGESLVLKIWPSREPARIMFSPELNQQFDILMERHCKP